MESNKNPKFKFGGKSRLFHKNKIAIVSILVASFIIGILLSFLLNRNVLSFLSSKQDKASLALSSDSKNIKQGKNLQVKILTDSGKQAVEAADIIIKYDPQYLKLINTTQGDFFANYQVTPLDNQTLKISGMAAIKDDTLIIPKGRGTIATLNFETIAAGKNIKVSIDKKDTVVASSGTNILGNTTDVTLNIEK